MEKTWLKVWNPSLLEGYQRNCQYIIQLPFIAWTLIILMFIIWQINLCFIFLKERLDSGFGKSVFRFTIQIFSRHVTVWTFPVPSWQTAAEDMENAIQDMKNQGVHSYILDLRNNPVIYFYDEKFQCYLISETIELRSVFLLFFL